MSKHGGGGRYDAIFRFQRGVFKKINEKWWMKENSKAMYVTSKVKVSQEKKWMNERMKERKKEKKEKYEKKIYIRVSVKWTPRVL
jgi:hypothetical protein